MKWTLEPGHSAAEFAVRHMMVTWVRGSFKNVTGTLEFDPADPCAALVQVSIDVKQLHSGDEGRDVHLLAEDFLNAEAHPAMTFKSTAVQMRGPAELVVTGDLAIRGVTRSVALDVNFLGQWSTPFWADGEDKGPIARAGFVATGKFNRSDFGMTWNGDLDNGGVVVGDEVQITIDAEALLDG
jgi:polyisoprenoid-binding protein YceI